jgi:activating signal cointegrator 1
MLALTLRQPWASLVAIGAKRLETRSWATKYRGDLAIHSSKNLSVSSRRLLDIEPVKSTLAEAGLSRDALPLGQVLAVVRLTAIYIVEWDQLPDEPERSFGDYQVGRFVWVLDDLRVLAEPIPAVGHLGLWRWDKELVDLVFRG